MVMTPDWEVVGCEFKYSTGIFGFLKKKPTLISLILNTKLKKHDSIFFPKVLIYIILVQFVHAVGTKIVEL